jgi:hypothetical protein
MCVDSYFHDGCCLIALFSNAVTVIVLSPFKYSGLLKLIRFLLVFPPQELSTIWNGISMTGGDWGSVCQLFFDNLSTMLGALFAMQNLSNTAAFGDIAVSPGTMGEVIWGKIVPGELNKTEDTKRCCSFSLDFDNLTAFAFFLRCRCYFGNWKCVLHISSYPVCAVKLGEV